MAKLRNLRGRSSQSVSLIALISSSIVEAVGSSLLRMGDEANVTAGTSCIVGTVVGTVVGTKDELGTVVCTIEELGTIAVSVSGAGDFFTIH